MTVNNSRQTHNHVVMDLAPRNRQAQVHLLAKPQNHQTKILEQRQKEEEIRSTMRKRLEEQPYIHKRDLFEELERSSLPMYRTRISVVETDIVAVIGIATTSATAGGFCISFAGSQRMSLACSYPKKHEVFDNQPIYAECLALTHAFKKIDRDQSITFIMSNPKLITYLNGEGILEPRQMEACEPVMGSLRAIFRTRTGYIQAFQCVTERAKQLQEYASQLAEDARCLKTVEDHISAIEELQEQCIAEIENQQTGSIQKVATSQMMTTTNTTSSAAAATKTAEKARNASLPQAQQLGNSHTPVRFQLPNNTQLPSAPMLHRNTGAMFITGLATQEEDDEVVVAPSDDLVAGQYHKIARRGQRYDPRPYALDRVGFATAASSSSSSSSSPFPWTMCHDDREYVDAYVDSIMTRHEAKQKTVAGTKRKMGDGGDDAVSILGSDKKKMKTVVKQQAAADGDTPSTSSNKDSNNGGNDSFIARSLNLMQGWFTGLKEKLTT